MSVATELTRIQSAKAALKTSIRNKGVSVSDDALISAYPALVDAIETGGGGDSDAVIRDLIEGDITSITIPSGTTKIKEHMFENNQDLTSVSIPDSVTDIGTNAFIACTALGTVNIPNHISNIGDRAFYGVPLTSLTIPETLLYIGSEAFEYSQIATLTLLGTPSITDYYTYPVFENNAFNYTPWWDNQSDGVVYIGYIAYGYKGWDGNPLNLTFANGTKMIGSNFKSEIGGGITSVTLPDSVECVGINAFNTCSSLTSVSFGENVAYIGNEAFAYTNVTTLSLPNSIDTIFDYAFRECTNLTSVTFGDGNDQCNLTGIQSGAFSGCVNLTSVTINNPFMIPMLGNDVFDNVENVTIYVPADMVSEFEADENWGYLNIQPIS